MARMADRAHSRSEALVTVEELNFRRERDASEAVRTAADRARGPRSVVLRRRRSDWSGDPRDPDEDAVWGAQRDVIKAASDTLVAQESSDELVGLCGAMGKELGIGEREHACLLAAAQVHDIGRVTMPREVLDKPGPLSAGDWSLMCQHTTIGERILRSVPEMFGVARIVRSSHERFDGRGYPDGLRGSQIPLASRIVLCAEAYHAMQAERPHRPAYSADEALDEIRANAGKQFDPNVVAALEVAIAGQQRPLAAIRRALSPR
jgi:HD-GYP domain-containing protein (c-di-GMP phosphodiesterase class II)